MASREVSRKRVGGPFLFLVVLAGSCLGVPALRGEPPALEEMIRASEDILLQMRAGKIHFRVQHVDTAGTALERKREEGREATRRAQIQASAQGEPEDVLRQSGALYVQSLDGTDNMATVQYLRDFSDDDVEMRFDRDRHACWVLRKPRRDWGPLIDQYALGETGLTNLPLSTQSARLADAIVTHTAYGSHQKTSYFSEPGTSRQEEAMLEWGLLLRKRLSGLTGYEPRIEDVGGKVELTFSKRGKPDFVLILDPALGLRICEERTVWKRAVVEQRKLSYRTFGNTLFPCEYVTTEYGPDDAVVEETIYQVSDASFTDSLDPSEFLLELPPGATVRMALPSDLRVGARVEPREATLPDGAPLRLGVEDIAKLFPARKP